MNSDTVSIWEMLTAIGTLAMAFFALCAYIHSLSEKSAKITFDLIVKKAKINGTICKFWCLRICNIGERAAKDVNISFDKSFLQNLPLKNSLCKIDNINRHPIHIRKGAELLYVLVPLRDDYLPFSSVRNEIDSWYKIYRNKPINIYYSYNGQCSFKCESLNLEQFETDNIIFTNDK